MYYVSINSTTRFSAFRVTAADYNGKEFDGAPFEGDIDHEWLHDSIKAGRVTLIPNRETDYAVWGVATTDGEIVLASPGDYIVKPDGSQSLYVCPGPLWELLAQPEMQVDELSQEEVDEKAHSELVSNWMREANSALEKDDPNTKWDILYDTAIGLYEVRDARSWRSGIDFAALVQKVERRVAQAESDVKAEAVAKEHRKEFDPSEWNGRVDAALNDPVTAWQVDWHQLFDELKSAIGNEVETISLPRHTFYLFGVLSYMVMQVPEKEDRYFRNWRIWEDVINESRAMGEKFVARVMEHRLPAGDVGDVICVSVIAGLTPDMAPPGSIPITDNEGNLHGTAHVGEVFQMEPRTKEE